MKIRRVLAMVMVGALLVLEAATPSYAAEPGHPTGTFTLDRTTAYLRVIDGDQDQPVGETFRITPSGVSDDETAPEDLVFEVSLGDGGGFTERPFPCSAENRACLMTYDQPGTFSPQARLTDQDGQSTTFALPAVRVLRDTTPPVVRVTRPRPRLLHRVSAWRVIRGTAIDQGVGTANVDVEVLQKRRTRWWCYDLVPDSDGQGAHRRWVRGLRTEAATFAKCQPHSHIATLVGNRWRTAWIKGLTRGTLVVRVNAMDANFWQPKGAPRYAWVRLTRR